MLRWTKWIFIEKIYATLIFKKEVWKWRKIKKKHLTYHACFSLRRIVAVGEYMTHIIINIDFVNFINHTLSISGYFSTHVGDSSHASIRCAITIKFYRFRCWNDTRNNLNYSRVYSWQHASILIMTGLHNL